MWLGLVVLESCPERTLEKHVVSTVLSGRDVVPSRPATAWLANFRHRFATKEWFLQSTSNIDRRTSNDEPLSLNLRRGCVLYWLEPRRLAVVFVCIGRDIAPAMSPPA